jgi:hypothetical protein
LPEDIDAMIQMLYPLEFVFFWRMGVRVLIQT